jgi:hypothetical protein
VIGALATELHEAVGRETALRIARVEVDEVIATDRCRSVGEPREHVEEMNSLRKVFRRFRHLLLHGEVQRLRFASMRQLPGRVGE